MRNGKVGVGIIASQFVAEIHAESFHPVPGAEVVASPADTPKAREE